MTIKRTTMAEASQIATAPPMDATALEIFQNQWEVYRKFLRYDYLSNGEAAGALRRYLTSEVARPYRFLDLACGDASGIAVALEGTPVEQYRGVDLSGPALAIARTNLATLPCPAELDES
ncbi:MAG: class I SAM-dependent methyltransferase, partial [Hyphomicrobium sp.]